MEGRVSNYRRFYAQFGKLAYPGDKEELKAELVSQCTGGRTTHLHEMTRGEYKVLCLAVERLTGLKERLRKERSSSLKLMQKLGVDTADWTRVNAFCQDARIAGKPFARISIEEHEVLQKKLRAIRRNGGLKRDSAAKNGDGMQKREWRRGEETEDGDNIIMMYIPNVKGEA